jgi:hypothetical protein
MTWQIFLGITEVVAFLIAIGTIVAKMSSVTTALKVMVEELRGALKEFKESAGAKHKELSDKLDDHSDKIADHEVRIHILEIQREDKNEKRN